MGKLGCGQGYFPELDSVYVRKSVKLRNFYVFGSTRRLANHAKRNLGLVANGLMVNGTSKMHVRVLWSDISLFNSTNL